METWGVECVVSSSITWIANLCGKIQKEEDEWYWWRLKFKLSWRGGSEEHDDIEKMDLPNNDGKNQS